MHAGAGKTSPAAPWRHSTLGMVLAAVLFFALPAWGQQAQSDAFSEGGSDSEFEQAFAQEGEGGAGDSDAPNLQFSGLLEVEQGTHFGPDGAQGREIVLSNRLVRLAGALDTPGASLLIKLDIVDDSVTGGTEVEVREGRAVLSPADWLDISVGKQVATWGVGDLLFINDLFPKNWLAIFLGRDPEFWKDSANALRPSLYFGNWTWDVVYHPGFTPDTTPTGCRFSVFDPNSGQLTAIPRQCSDPTPAFSSAGTISEGETASRLKVQMGSHDLAFYAYSGFFKSPRGLRWADGAGNPTGNPTPVPGAGDVMLVPFHPRLNVYGISEEGQVGAGVLSLEAGYYESKDDPRGDNPLIENSLWKLLAGYRLDWTANFATGAQWFRESMQDFGAFRASLPPQQATVPRARNRNTYTLRLTLKLQQEILRINLFRYERPQDRDRFTKLDFSKRLTDHVVIAAGVNVFDGAQGYEDREFGMLRDDDNAFARIRFSY